MVIVHGVLRERDVTLVDRLPGSSELRPRAVTAGALAAVVSDAPPHELTGDDAVAHLDLLVAAAQDAPVLPFALGTTVPDDDAVREIVLLPDADGLAQRLEALADVVELRLDLTFDNDAAVSAIAREDPELRRLADRARGPRAGIAERLALGEATALRVADHQAALAEAWTGELAGLAERLALLQTDEQLRRTAYLMRRDRLADADEAVARMWPRTEGLAEVEYVGPLPVFTFLDDLDVGAAPAPAEPPPSRWGW